MSSTMMFPDEEDFRRILEEEEVSESDTSRVVRDTFRIYGSIYAVLFIIFCVARKKFPGAYNVRNYYSQHNCDLASNQYGYVSWTWNMFARVTDDELFEQCGMDAVSFIRMMTFGLKVSLIGVFNSLYLMPIYGTAPWSEETAAIEDPLQEVTMGNVPESDPRLFATVVASYILMGYTMYLILREFKWFTVYRHKFISKTVPNNYTVYVGGIPEEYQSNAELLDYFRTCFSYDSVIEAQMALNIPDLEKKHARRQALVDKLEHAINVQDIKGVTPMHRTRTCGGEKVNSIEAYSRELDELNKEISAAIDKIRAMHDPKSYSGDLEDAQEKSSLYRTVQKEIEESNHTHTSIMVADDEVFYDEMVKRKGGGKDASKYFVEAPPPQTPLLETAIVEEKESLDKTSDDESTKGTKESAAKDANGTTTGNNAKSHRRKTSLETISSALPSESAHAAATKTFGKAMDVGSAFATTAVTTLLGGEDGTSRDAAFVSFSSLKSTMSALQMIHHHQPFVMYTEDAPLPEDIFWSNVGITNKARHLGRLLSFGLTCLLCCFWTVPMSFLASFSNVEALTEQLPFLEDWLEAAPWLEAFLAQLAPLLVIAINGLLPTILGWFAKLEGHIAESSLSASLFVKLAWFNIIQTFFVSAISGSIWAELQNIIDNPTSIIEFLAQSIPQQSAYFMQILLVRTFIGQAIEMLRVKPLAMAWLRSCIGPNLTEEERNKPYFILFPFAEPETFEHADVLAELVLYFIVAFVYSPMAPFTCYVQVFNFFLMTMVYRHQLIYNYPTGNDSGGKLFLKFIKIILIAMLIAELTMLGYLGIKKAPISVFCYIPLVVITVLFMMYIGEQHYYVTQHLPTRDAIKRDLQNNAERPMDYDFVKEKYVQEALQERIVQPSNLGDEREIAREAMNYFTPPGSEAEPADSDDETMGTMMTLMGREKFDPAKAGR